MRGYYAIVNEKTNWIQRRKNLLLWKYTFIFNYVLFIYLFFFVRFTATETSLFLFLTFLVHAIFWIWFSQIYWHVCVRAASIPWFVFFSADRWSRICWINWWAWSGSRTMIPGRVISAVRAVVWSASGLVFFYTLIFFVWFARLKVYKNIKLNWLKKLNWT